MAILVTGGAGYIGSVTAERLRAKGEQIVILDDLFRGHREALDPATPFYQGRVGDAALVARILKEHEIEACVHFAALAFVGESVEQPAKYFENNVQQGVAFLSSLLAAGVRRFVFSSTCATYGEPEKMPISEDFPQWPTNPYGWTKLTLERVLASYDSAYGLKFVALRYFNAAGASELRGEHHEPESHLVPNVLAVAMGARPEVAVFGKDYPTPDGTCIRDYVHVADLADAHILALEHLRRGGASDFLNLGTGHGYSVLEVIEAARKVTGHPIPMRIEARRAGDPPSLVADASKAKKILGWSPTQSDLLSILRSDWEWRRKHPHGYAAK
ncbi:MAG TPA: UDP-glucose 4-epimerase GalE [Candidatus Acidoferrales bacterium]|nr:UDP-glucose 4-epimerase GalE [Candidatus Acidoferrales bacterium]